MNWRRRGGACCVNSVPARRLLVVIIGAGAVWAVVRWRNSDTPRRTFAAQLDPPMQRTSRAAPLGMVWVPGGEFFMGSDESGESLCGLPGVTRDASASNAALLPAGHAPVSTVGGQLFQECVHAARAKAPGWFRTKSPTALCAVAPPGGALIGPIRLRVIAEVLFRLVLPGWAVLRERPNVDQAQIGQVREHQFIWRCVQYNRSRRRSCLRGLGHAMPHNKDVMLHFLRGRGRRLRTRRRALRVVA